MQEYLTIKVRLEDYRSVDDAFQIIEAHVRSINTGEARGMFVRDENGNRVGMVSLSVEEDGESV